MEGVEEHRGEHQSDRWAAQQYQQPIEDHTAEDEFLGDSVHPRLQADNGKGRDHSARPAEWWLARSHADQPECGGDDREHYSQAQPAWRKRQLSRTKTGRKRHDDGG